MTMTAEQIAQVCHGANRSLQKIQNDPGIPVAPEWDDLDAESQESIIQGVEGVRRGNSPRESHADWVQFKLDHGWKLGPVKDEKKREHPLLVDYDDLPESQKLKDALFIAIVVALSQQQHSDVVSQDKTNEQFREGFGEGR